MQGQNWVSDCGCRHIRHGRTDDFFGLADRQVGAEKAIK